VEEAGHHHGLPNGVPIPPPLAPGEDPDNRDYREGFSQSDQRPNTGNNPSSR